MDSAALQHRAFKRRTSFCFCRRASRFVQKAQEQSRRIKRRLGSSSSIGRDMAGVVELPVHHTEAPTKHGGVAEWLPGLRGGGTQKRKNRDGRLPATRVFCYSRWSPSAQLAMKFSVVPTTAVALGLSCGVESFVAPFPVGQQHRCSSAFSAHMIRAAGARSSSSSRARLMMGGFGEPVKKKKPVGVGRGQEAYQRQMKSYNGLIAAGAEGTDLYVHREAS